MLTRKVIRVDGTEEPLDKPVSIREINALIKANGIDTVVLDHKRGRPNWIMAVDDTGMIDGKPINKAATALYHSVCRPGVTHPIAGDVVIALDSDFGSD